ncbi:MAG: phage major capsid protein [Pseudomonadota bacterium]
MTNQEMASYLRGESKELMRSIQAEKRKPTAEESAEGLRLLDAADKYMRGENMNVEGYEPTKPDPGKYETSEKNINKTGAKDLSFRGMFYPDLKPDAVLDKGGFKDMAEFVRVFDSGRYDPRLDALYDKRASMAEIPGSFGGLVVPTQFSSVWLDESLPAEICRNLAQVFPMKSSSLLVPGWDGADQSDGSLYGGFKMEFKAEGQAASKQTARVRNVNLTAKFGMIFVDASLELASDGIDFAKQLETALIKSIGYGIDYNCIRGSGAGRPLGAINAPCKIQVAKEAGASADTIGYKSLKKMFARQLNPGNAVWLFNNNAIPELLEVTVPVGTGGSHVKLLNETDGKFTIFGRPVYFHPAMPPVGDANDCLFIDWSMYALGIRQDVLVDVTDAHRWTQRERSYRVLIRFDGQPTLAQAVKPANGDTLSPIVTLAERA